MIFSEGWVWITWLRGCFCGNNYIIGVIFGFNVVIVFLSIDFV